MVNFPRWIRLFSDVILQMLNMLCLCIVANIMTVSLSTLITAFHRFLGDFLGYSRDDISNLPSMSHYSIYLCWRVKSEIEIVFQ